MSKIHVVNTYPHPIGKVWAALTDPALVPLWTVTGRGGRPEGFRPTVGTRFTLVGKPILGWDGVVHCEVLEVDPPRFLEYSWTNHPDDGPTIVTYTLSPSTEGTTFVFDHTGFKGPGGFIMSRLLGRVRRKMLTTGLPPVLDDLTEAGTLREGSQLRPKS